MSQHTKLHIKGMTCVSCETLISQELKSLPGLQHSKVSCKSHTAELLHDDSFEIKGAINKINQLDYRASLQPWPEERSLPKASAGQWFNAILLVMALYLVWRIVNNLGWFTQFSFNDKEIGYGLAILIGVVASLSTCLMVVGSVVMSFGAKYQAAGVSFYNTAVKPHLLFHTGRLASFFILGGVLGLIGSWISLSQGFWGWFTLAVAIILALLGFNILGLGPTLSKMGLHLPKGLTKFWHKLQESNHPLAPAALGGFTFFLPCGFTQSLQLYAISTGNFWTGAYTMLFFGLGTAPVLLGLGIATSKFKNKRNVVLQKAIGLVVILFALYIFTNGAALLGFNLKLPKSAGAVGTAQLEQNEQVVNMAVTYRGYQPDTLEIIQGVPVKWVINGDQVTGCTSQIVVPSLNIRQQLTKGENIIRFTPQQAGTINFSCSMGMVRGQFIVKPSSSASSGQVPAANAGSNTDSSCPIDPNTGVTQCQSNPPDSSVPSAQAAPDNGQPQVAGDNSINGEQVVTMTVDGRGYTPDILYAKAGAPVKWVIKAADNLGCTSVIKLQDGYNISQRLRPGENIIRFTPKSAGEILFSCGMEMVWGKFIITDSGQPTANSIAPVSATLASRNISPSCGGGSPAGGAGCGGGGGCGCGGGGGSPAGGAGCGRQF